MTVLHTSKPTKGQWQTW